MSKELLVAFFYILIRDHITLGDLHTIKYHLEAVKEMGGAAFENELMKDMATQMAEYILNA
jgi:hypothetical protein